MGAGARIAGAAALAALGGGCFAPTPYQPLGAMGGYAERPINARGYEVWFHGNGFTSQASAERFAMRRAAELTMQRGLAGFVLAASATNANVSQWTTPVRCSGGPLGPQCSGGQTETIATPSSHVTFMMLSAQEAHAEVSAGRAVYDAGLLLGRGSTIDSVPASPGASPPAPAAAPGGTKCEAGWYTTPQGYCCPYGYDDAGNGTCNPSRTALEAAHRPATPP